MCGYTYALCMRTWIMPRKAQIFCCNLCYYSRIDRFYAADFVLGDLKITSTSSWDNPIPMKLLRHVLQSTTTNTACSIMNLISSSSGIAREEVTAVPTLTINHIMIACQHFKFTLHLFLIHSAITATAQIIAAMHSHRHRKEWPHRVRLTQTDRQTDRDRQTVRQTGG